MATRLPGDGEHHYRTTDHSDEIAQLREMADKAEERHEKVTIHLAADLLQSHDDTGISLDDWPYARQFVEFYLGKPILPNLI